MDYSGIPADKSGYAPVKGGKVYYRLNKAKSAGKSPLIVIHGGPGMGHEYLLPVLDLADERDVIFYDQLDAGKSKGTNSPADWELEKFTDEIDSVRKELGIDDFNILCSSWGCSIAVNYAARKPRGLKSIVLSGALVTTKRWIDDNAVYRKQLSPDVQAVLDKYEKAGDYANPEYQDAVMAFYKKHLCRLDVWPDYMNRSMANANFDQYVYMWGPTEFLCTGTLKSLDLLPLLKNIEIPALFVNGEFDEGTPDSAEYFAGHMKNAKTAVIKGASHTPHIEKTEEFMKAVNSFLIL